MGQETYALLKLRSKTIPSAIRRELTGNAYEPFLVRNIALPACLVWTPINYHDISDPEALKPQLLSHVPAELLVMNVEPRGILMFADGGEPRRSWPQKTTYEQLEREVICNGLVPLGVVANWVTIDPDELPAPRRASSVDELLLTMPDRAMWKFIEAANRGRLDEAKRLLVEQVGTKRYEQMQLDKQIENWLQTSRAPARGRVR